MTPSPSDIEALALLNRLSTNLVDYQMQRAGATSAHAAILAPHITMLEQAVGLLKTRLDRLTAETALFKSQII